MATRFSQAGLQVMLGSDGVVRFTQAGLQALLDTGDFPVVTITTPASSPAQVVEPDTILLEATASDTEDGDLTSSIEWRSSIDGVLGTGASVEPQLSLGEHDILAVVTDSDGHTGYAWIVVNVVSDPPTVDVVAPDDGHTVREGEAITFSGTASDPQEGDISSQIEWTSDIDGVIGTGASISPVLTDGDHTVTARATDSGGGFGEDTVSVVVTENNPPSEPVVNRPVTDEVVSDQLVIEYDASPDPESDPVTYHFQYREIGDPDWIVAFTGRSSTDAFLEDLTGLPGGDYEWQMWASDGVLQSTIASDEFFLHAGQPTAPEITNPLQGQEVTAAPVTVTWDEAIDLEGDPLTYAGEFKEPGGNWTPLFSGVSGTSFVWDLTGEPTGAWKLRIWANDGVADGPTDEVTFGVVSQNRPTAPAIKIAEVGTDFVRPEAREYGHPFDVAWQATQYQIRPQLGDWSNPTLDVTTTDPAEQLTRVLSGLAAGFAGEVRMRFQDTNDQWSDWSPVADFETLSAVDEWEQQISPGKWSPFGSRIIGQFIGDHVADALVVKDAPKLGSARLKYHVMLDGCFCGLSGRDHELRHLGGGLFDGFASLGTSKSVQIYLDTGINASHPDFSHVVGVDLNIVVPIDSNQAHVRIADLGIMAGRDGDSDFSTDLDVEPWYEFTVEIQRDLAAKTTRIRARVEGPLIKTVPDGEWHLDEVLPTVTPCGRPGYYQNQEAFQLGSAVTWFRRLEFTALRDEGLSDVTTLAPLPDVPDDPDPACVPVTEPSPAGPVLWPAGPTTEDVVREERAWLTDVIDAHDDTEQRVQLREVPVVTLSWTARVVGSEVGLVQSLLYGSQNRRWGVPLWPDGVRLLEDLPDGSISIPASSIDVAGRRFAPVGEEARIALWRGVEEAEMLRAEREVDGSITLLEPASQLWPAGTRVYPVLIGRLPQQIRAPRPGTTISDVECAFRLEAVQ